ncbi:MAG TPA: hypothetical protein VFM14_10845 [Gemmatimonadales bacterium]|nr:hypothetical protein [Gemmatimonadales bacterium]
MSRQSTRRSDTLWGAALAAAACSVLLLGRYAGAGGGSDFDQLYVASRALVSGGDPFRAVSTAFPFALYYPLPAVIAVLPFAWLPIGAARLLWSAAVGAGFGLAASRRPSLLPAALSACFLQAVLYGQWSPLVTAGAVVPLLGASWVAKPSIGLALAAGYMRRTALASALLLLLASLLVMPTWPSAWLDAIRGGPHRPPLLRPGGVLLLVSLLRWRAPEGRLLAALALVPQSTAVYEALPLFLVARTRWEGYLLAAGSYVAAYAGALLVPAPSLDTFQADMSARWPALLIGMYLPALGLVLTRARRDPADARIPEAA